MIDGTQEGALAAAARPDNHHDLALADLQIHTPQYMVVTEIFVDAVGFHHPTGRVFVRWRHVTIPPRPVRAAAPCRANGLMPSPIGRNAPQAAAAQSPTGWSAADNTVLRR